MAQKKMGIEGRNNKNKNQPFSPSQKRYGFQYQLVVSFLSLFFSLVCCTIFLQFQGQGDGGGGTVVCCVCMDNNRPRTSKSRLPPRQGRRKMKKTNNELNNNNKEGKRLRISVSCSVQCSCCLDRGHIAFPSSKAFFLFRLGQKSALFAFHWMY